MLLTEENVAEMLRDYRSIWLYAEPATKDGYCPRTTALFRKLRQSLPPEAIGGGVLRFQNHWPLGIVTVSKAICPPKRLRALAPEVIPERTRRARNILASDLESATKVYKTLLSIALRNGFAPREHEHEDGSSVYPMYLQILFPEGSQEKSGIYAMDEKGDLWLRVEVEDAPQAPETLSPQSQ